MHIFLGELLGTFFLILLGDGVVANVLLNRTKGNNSGWIVITFGWAIAVFVGVFIASKLSGAHLNPAVSIGLAAAGKIEWNLVPDYIEGQMAGAMLGAMAVWLSYYQHFKATDDKILKISVFCTGPAINGSVYNVITEAIGTFVLMMGVFMIIAPSSSLGALDALPVALLVLGIGLSLGGPTGYAINPARDLGPRIMHALLPMGVKGKSDWGYAWVPVIGPVIGTILAALVYMQLPK